MGAESKKTSIPDETSLCHCTYCQSPLTLVLPGIRDYLVRKGDSPEFSVFYCSQCELGYTKPDLSEDELSAYYPSEYQPYHKGAGFRGWLQRVKYALEIRLIESETASKQLTVFEVGAGSGEFLSRVQSRGHSVGGLEPSEQGCNEARRQFDLKLSASNADGYRFEKKWEVIVARSVLEHLNDPFSLLRRIEKEGLTPNGLLFLKLPSMDGWLTKFFGRFWIGWDVPRHRVHFTEAGVRNLLESMGYVRIKVRKEAIGIDLTRSLYFAARFGGEGWAGGWRWMATLARAMPFLPEPIQMILSQIVCTAFILFGPGRMVVTAHARGPKTS